MWDFQFCATFSVRVHLGPPRAATFLDRDVCNHCRKRCDTSLVQIATIDDVKRAWAKLIGVPELTKYHLIIAPISRIAPPGWIGLLVIDDTLTVCVPTLELKERVSLAISGLGPVDATTPAVILSKLPSTIRVLGPAGLFYNFGRITPDKGFSAESFPKQSLSFLIDSVFSEELEESGITEIDGDAFAICSDRGEPIAACGYRVWPNGVANICVLVHPEHRRLGYAYSLASATIARAEREGLLAQWRALPESSRRLAFRLGLIEVGAQLNLELS
jgi:GNAT superfamily N-acetyltransferase